MQDTLCHKKCPCRKKKHPCGYYCHPGKTCANKSNTGEPKELIDLSEPDQDVAAQPFAGIWTTVGRTELTIHDRNVLVSLKWLNDKHMHAAQQLLKKQHPHVGGLQNILLQSMGTFDIQKNCEFVECLNLGSSHWITVSTIGCPPAVIRVHGSLRYQLPLSVKKTIADLIQTEKKHVVIEHSTPKGW